MKNKQKFPMVLHWFRWRNWETIGKNRYNYNTCTCLPCLWIDAQTNTFYHTCSMWKNITVQRTKDQTLHIESNLSSLSGGVSNFGWFYCHQKKSTRTRKWISNYVKLCSFSWAVYNFYQTHGLLHIYYNDQHIEGCLVPNMWVKWSGGRQGLLFFFTVVCAELASLSSLWLVFGQRGPFCDIIHYICSDLY